jgi:hypothetical protein
MQSFLPLLKSLAPFVKLDAFDCLADCLTDAISTRKPAVTQSGLQNWEKPKVAWCEIRRVRGVTNALNVILSNKSCNFL